MNLRSCLVVALLAAGVLAVACEQTAAENAEPPAQVEQIQGSNVSKVVLTRDAAERIGLTTAPVQASAAATSAPLAAVVYDRDGSTWVYTVAAPLTYVRQRVTVTRVAGDVAFLQGGPAAGTDVVTVGAAELLGAEQGVEGE